MRNDFVRQLREEMKQNKNIFFLTGDLGFNALESLQKDFPDRFMNVGIAESNMIGIAAGLALTGKKVIAYSIASFASMRGYEQIRNDVCYHNLDVKIIGTGGGYNYGNHGVTHHTVEDLSIMSALPNMKVFNPGYSGEAIECTKTLLRDSGPCYMRLGKAPVKDYGTNPVIRKGTDILILSTGNIIDYAIEAAELIKDYSVQVVSVPQIKPLNIDHILEMAKDMQLVVTLEENTIYGGLGSQVAMALAESGTHLPFLTLGIPDAFIKTVGSRAFLLKDAGLDPESIVKKITWKLKK